VSRREVLAALRRSGGGMEALLKLGRREEARRSALLALKVAPTYARAQDILIAASGN